MTHVGAVVLCRNESRVLDQDDVGTLEKLLTSRSGVVGELKSELVSNAKSSGSEVGLVDALE